MRDPARIKPFMQKLAHVWQRNFSDLRFGQLMSNFFGFVVAETHRDIFFIEDDEMEKLMLKFFEEKKTDECNLEVPADE